MEYNEFQMEEEKENQKAIIQLSTVFSIRKESMSDGVNASINL